MKKRLNLDLEINKLKIEEIKIKQRRNYELKVRILKNKRDQTNK